MQKRYYLGVWPNPSVLLGVEWGKYELCVYEHPFKLEELRTMVVAMELEAANNEEAIHPKINRLGERELFRARMLRDLRCRREDSSFWRPITELGKVLDGPELDRLAMEPFIEVRDQWSGRPDYWPLHVSPARITKEEIYNDFIRLKQDYGICAASRFEYRFWSMSGVWDTLIRVVLGALVGIVLLLLILFIGGHLG